MSFSHRNSSQMCTNKTVRKLFSEYLDMQRIKLKRYNSHTIVMKPVLEAIVTGNMSRAQCTPVYEFRNHLFSYIFSIVHIIERYLLYSLSHFHRLLQCCLLHFLVSKNVDVINLYNYLHYITCILLPKIIAIESYYLLLLLL